MAGSDAQALLLQVSADTSKALKQLDGLSKKLSGVATDADKASKKAGTSLEKFFGKTDPAKALDKVFDSTRFKILDSGVAKVGLMGSALESLGVTGLAAAASIGAVAAAFAGAREAAKFADDINDTAAKLHVTTDALQEYRYAIRAAGGEEAGADEALESFNVTLGKAQAGLPKALKAFQELGFTKDQVKGFTDADTALKAVTERIAGLSDVQKDAVIDQLGLTGLKPLIEGGIASMQRLRDEAHKVGIVMDAELVKRGGDLNDQFETVTKVIDVQLKSALVDIGPILAGLLGLMAKLAAAAADVVDAFRSVDNRTTQGLQRQLEDLKARRANGPSLGDRVKDVAVANIPVVGPDLAAARAQANTKAGLDAQIASIEAVLAARQKANSPPPIKPTRALIDQTKTPKTAAGPRDDTAQRTAEVNGQLDDAERDLLSAWSRLVIGADQQAELQKSIVDVEQRILNDKLDKQEADIRADRGISQAKQDELVANLESVRVQQANVADLQKELIDRQATEQKAADALKLREADLDAQTELLQIQDSLASTAKERRDIELRLLDLADQREKAELDAVLASKTASEADKAIAKKKLDTLNATAPARQEQVVRNTQGPLEQFVFDNTDAERSAEKFQSLTVSAFDNLNSGIANLIANGGKAGDVLRGIVRQLLIDVTKQNLQEAEASLLSKFGGVGRSAATGGLPGQATAAAISAAGSTSATSIGAAIDTAGTAAATAMATAITAAGSQVAAAIATALAAAGATSGGAGGLGSLFSLFGGAGGGFDLGSSSGFNIAAGSMPMFAKGTDFAPGGMALVGEEGPELVNLPRGSQVTPHSQTLSALKNMTPPQASPSVTVIQPMHFHAEGAVLTQEILSQANAHANKVAAQAGQWARTGARQDGQKSTYSGNLNA